MSPKQAHKKVMAAAKAKKQSLRAYCKERGVSHSTVSRWKKGDRVTMRLSTFEKLLGTLG